MKAQHSTLRYALLAASAGLSLAVALPIAFSDEATLATTPPATQESSPESKQPVRTPPTVEQARLRAELLHETMHATLQIVHQEYYREDEGLPIPAATLKRVFSEIESAGAVKLRWIAVNAPAMNIDHASDAPFEKRAVRELTSGKKYFESVDEGVYRRAAPITLHAECLKCHLPNRTSTRSRMAGLVISMPVRPK